MQRWTLAGALALTGCGGLARPTSKPKPQPLTLMSPALGAAVDAPVTFEWRMPGGSTTLRACNLLIKPSSGRSKIDPVTLPDYAPGEVIEHTIEHLSPGRYQWALECTGPAGQTGVGRTAAGERKPEFTVGGAPPPAPPPTKVAPAPVPATPPSCKAPLGHCDDLKTLRTVQAELERLHARSANAWGVALDRLFKPLLGPKRPPTVSVRVVSSGLAQLRDPTGRYPVRVEAVIGRPGLVARPGAEAAVAAAESLVPILARFRADRAAILARVPTAPTVSPAAEALLDQQLLVIKLADREIRAQVPRALLAARVAALPKHDHKLSVALVGSSRNHPRERLAERLAGLGQAHPVQVSPSRVRIDARPRPAERRSITLQVPAARGCDRLRVEARVATPGRPIRRSWRLGAVKAKGATR